MQLRYIKKWAGQVSVWFYWIAAAGLIGLISLTVADVVGAKFFRYPIPGAVEVTGYLGVVITAFAIAFTQVLRGHIQVEFFVMRLPERARAATASFTSLLALAFFVLLAWRSWDFGYILQLTGEVSPSEEICFYPFVYAIALCCLPMCLLLLVEFLESFVRAVSK